MTLGNVGSFMRARVPGNKIELITPLGRFVFGTEREADDKAQEILLEMEKRLGRWPTSEECQRGPQCKDDRSLEQRMARANFKPVVAESKHPLEALADSLDEPERPDYSGMTRNQRLAADARRIVERESEATVAAQAEKERVARYSKQVTDIDKLIDREKWNGGSQLLVDRLEMLKEQMLAPGACPEATAQKKKGVQQMLNERAENQRQQQKAEIAALEARLNAVKGGEVLNDVDDQIAELDAREAELKQQSYSRVMEDAGIAQSKREHEIARRVEAGEHPQDAREAVMSEAFSS